MVPRMHNADSSDTNTFNWRLITCHQKVCEAWCLVFWTNSPMHTALTDGTLASGLPQHFLLVAL